MEEVRFYSPREIHSDSRRSIFEVFAGNFDLREITRLSVKSTQVMGNHYHTHPELFYMDGQGVWTVKDINGGKVQRFEFNKGSCLYLPPNFAHALEPTEGLELIAITGGVFSPDNTRPYELVKPNTKRQRYI